MSETDPDRPPPRMSESARYQIRVRGHVEPVTARRLRGLSVANGADETGAPVATLRGELPDQAALIGVLHTLNDHHLPLLSAEFQTPTEDLGDVQAGWHPIPLENPPSD